MHREDQIAAGNLQEGKKDEHLDDCRSDSTRYAPSLPSGARRQSFRVTCCRCFPGKLAGGQLEGTLHKLQGGTNGGVGLFAPSHPALWVVICWKQGCAACQSASCLKECSLSCIVGRAPWGPGYCASCRRVLKQNAGVLPAHGRATKCWERDAGHHSALCILAQHKLPVPGEPSSVPAEKQV